MNALYRPRDGRIVAGVCAGLARSFGVPVWTVRLLTVLSCLLPGPQFIAYIVLWIVMPDERRVAAGAEPYDRPREPSEPYETTRY